MEEYLTLNDYTTEEVYYTYSGALHDKDKYIKSYTKTVPTSNEEISLSAIHVSVIISDTCMEVNVCTCSNGCCSDDSYFGKADVEELVKFISEYKDYVEAL